MNPASIGNDRCFFHANFWKGGEAHQRFSTEGRRYIQRNHALWEVIDNNIVKNREKVIPNLYPLPVEGSRSGDPMWAVAHA